MIFFTQAGELIGHIHQEAIIQKQKIPGLFYDNHFFKSLRIDPYYLETLKAEPKTKTFLNDLISESFEDRYTLVHGDFSPKNLLVKNDRLILLDHEVIHFGDATFDLGFFMAHIFSKAHHIPAHREEFLKAISEFYDAYLTKFQFMDEIRERRAVKHTIGCFLARVCGLSRLEYLNHAEQTRQRLIGLELVNDSPSTIKDLISRFNEKINACN